MKLSQELETAFIAEMLKAAEALEFERAATLRDQITAMQESVGKKVSEVSAKSRPSGRRRRGRKGNARVPRPRKP